MPADDQDADLLRQFEAAISGAELADLRQLARDLALFGSPRIRPPRPRLRRPPLAEPVTFRIRAELDGSEPAIWRLLDIRSDVMLPVLHQALQAAMGWWDYHLHRFSIGGGPFDDGSEWFLSPEDLAEAEEDEGTETTLIRLDETVQQAGDVLHYAYDYGDSWEMTLRLEQVLPIAPDSPAAACIAGGRAAPPEDCGGLRLAEQLAEVLDDPSAFDIESVNQRLQQPYFVLADSGIDPRLIDLVHRLRFTPLGDDLAARLTLLSLDAREPDDHAKAAALRAHRWFLDHAAGDGIPLTAAGYLRPSDVAAVAPLVPTVAEFAPHVNREVSAFPLIWFRESLRDLGLVRKLKGRLVLTKAGKAAHASLARLWSHLVERLVPASDDSAADDMDLLLLLFAATSRDGSMPLDQIAEALAGLGWQTSRGPLRAHDLYHVPVLAVLRNVSDSPTSIAANEHISPVAAALARAVLLRGGA